MIKDYGQWLTAEWEKSIDDQPDSPKHEDSDYTTGITKGLEMALEKYQEVPDGSAWTDRPKAYPRTLCDYRHRDVEDYFDKYESDLKRIPKK